MTAADGEEGLRLANVGRFDLILVDLLMPKKPDIDVLTDLKTDMSTRHIPVLILSNSSREEDKRRAVALGAIGYHVKANLFLKALGDEIAHLLA